MFLASATLALVINSRMHAKMKWDYLDILTVSYANYIARIASEHSLWRGWQTPVNTWDDGGTRHVTKCQLEAQPYCSKPQTSTVRSLIRWK